MRERLRGAGMLIALGVLALLAWRLRPAQVRAAQVTAVTPGAPPLAHVSLSYGGGARPTSAIVDVLGAQREALGSVTVDGHRALLEIPLHRESASYHVQVTTAHRMPWGSVIRTV